MDLNMKPLISVIVPVYNVAPYLRQCVDSILGQSFRNFELILVDDGSPDNSGAICDEYASADSRVHVIHQQNGGLSAARNAALDWMFANSSSEYVTFVDSDDWVDERYLELFLDVAGKTGSPLVAGRYTLVDADGSFEKGPSPGATAFDFPGTEDFWCRDWGMSNVACVKLYHRELLKDIRYPLGKINEDAFTTYKIAFRLPNVPCLLCPTYFCRRTPGSITRSAWTPRRFDEADAIEGQIQFFQDHGFMRARTLAIHCFLWSLYKNYQAVSAPDSQYSGLKREARLRFVHSFKRYARGMGFSILKNARYYKVLYPRTFTLRQKYAQARDWLRRRSFSRMLRQVCRRLLGVQGGQ